MLLCHDSTAFMVGKVGKNDWQEWQNKVRQIACKMHGFVVLFEWLYAFPFSENANFRNFSDACVGCTVMGAKLQDMNFSMKLKKIDRK